MAIIVILLSPIPTFVGPVQVWGFPAPAYHGGKSISGATPVTATMESSTYGQFIMGAYLYAILQDASEPVW